MTLLSLLIPTTPDRADMTEALRHLLASQIRAIGAEGAVKIHILDTLAWDRHNPLQEHCIGWKRNRLLELSTGLYTAFIDSDDRVAQDYVELVLEGIDHGKDCCSLNGIITEDGKNPLRFQHSIRHKAYSTAPDAEPIRFLRFPNHLNCIRADIAKQFRFPDIMSSEDTSWATQLHNSGLLKTEHWIEETIYYYDYVRNK